jgi:succinoglycan biosynthesis protein ExoA
MSLPKISIVLPVRNESRCIGKLLDELMQQTYPSDRYEIIVADGRSTDNTRDIVLARAAACDVSIQLVDNPGIRSGAGRNAGVAASTGDVILFIDGHCEIPSQNLLHDTALLLQETGADCLCRPQPLIAFNPSGAGRIIANARASAFGHGRDSLIYDMNHRGFVHPASSGATYRRAIFSEIGGFDESFDACEDVEFNTRVAAAGHQAYTDPRLAVYYEPRRSFSGLFRQMMGYGIGRVRLARKHPGSKSISQWAPAVLVAALGAGILSVVGGAVTGKWWIAILAAPVALFGLLTIVASVNLGRRNGWSHFLLGPLAYWAVYVGLGAGIWREMMRPAATVTRYAPETKPVSPPEISLTQASGKTK